MDGFGLTINGEQVTTDDTRDILNPSTGEVVGACPMATESQVNDAVAAANAAYPAWSATSDDDRKAAVHALGKVLEDNAEDLARLLTEEQGKPLNGLGSRFELGGAQAWTHYTADLELPMKVLQDDNEGRLELHRKPLGVVGSITPWNWPLMIAIWHLAPAIRMGNTVVIKPSPHTPLSTLKMVELMSAVLPAGVLNAVAGTDDIGPWMTDHDDIRKITFTGSCGTGRHVMRSAARTLKRVTLELGGNDAGIILPDADPAAIAEGLFWGAFINNGQTCAALKRLYVPESLHDAVCEALVGFAGNMPMGDGLDEANVIGPIQNKMQFDKVRDLVEDAKTNGADILCGGEAPDGPGYFYPTTIVAGLTNGARLVDEEQFGPVLPVIKYTDVEEAVAMANDSEFGLGGSVWSPDIAKAAEIGARLECGSLWVNKHGAIQPNAPFGGIKSSGMGVEFGEEGLQEFTSIQVIHR